MYFEFKFRVYTFNECRNRCITYVIFYKQCRAWDFKYLRDDINRKIHVYALSAMRLVPAIQYSLCISAAEYKTFARSKM